MNETNTHATQPTLSCQALTSSSSLRGGGWRQLGLRVFAFCLIQCDDDAFNCSLRNILPRMITGERTSTSNKSQVSSLPSFSAGLPRLRKLHLRQRTPRDGMHKARNHPLCTASTPAIGTHQRAQSRPRLPHAQHPSRVRDPEKQRERRPHVSSRGRETELHSAFLARARRNNPKRCVLDFYFSNLVLKRF